MPQVIEAVTFTEGVAARDTGNPRRLVRPCHPDQGTARPSSAAGANPCVMPFPCPPSRVCGAIRFNPDLKAKYTALRAAGKPAKVAIVALMRKLLETANALVKADRLWVEKAP